MNKFVFVLFTVFLMCFAPATAQRSDACDVSSKIIALTHAQANVLHAGANTSLLQAAKTALQSAECGE